MLLCCQRPSMTSQPLTNREQVEGSEHPQGLFLQSWYLSLTARDNLFSNGGDNHHSLLIPRF